MIELLPPIKCKVKETPDKGFGVFATSPIVQNEIVEECRLILMPKPECMPGILDHYRFSYPVGGDQIAITLGFGSIYNHSYTPNLLWRDHPRYKEIFQFIALRNIHPGEELCTFYGNKYFN